MIDRTDNHILQVQHSLTLVHCCAWSNLEWISSIFTSEDVSNDLCNKYKASKTQEKVDALFPVIFRR